MTREKVTSIAATCMSAIAAIATFYVSPLIEQGDAESAIKLIAILVGIPGFYFVFVLVYRGLSYYRYRHILGTWYYVTSSFEDVSFKDGNFGRMRFSLGDGDELDYLVDLYESEDALFSQQGAKLLGRAYSDALRYNVSKKTISILYHVQYTGMARENPDRYGRLFLNVTDEGTLQGTWVSDLHRRQISAGNMYAARPSAFREGLATRRSGRAA
jgi:hypothetical protein